MVPGMERRKALLYGAVFVAALVFRSRFHGHLPQIAFDRVLWTRWQYRVALWTWVLFSLYWEYAKRDSAVAVRSESASSRGLHVGLASLAQLMVLIPFAGVARVVPVSGVLMGVGLAMEGLGVAVAVWARVRLGRQWSGEITIKEDHRLIRSGPYKSVRHPIYTGLLAMYLGSALVVGTWVALAGVVLAGLAYWRKVGLEERNLEEAFGAEYEGYREETWELLPGVF